jgi:hypothetical protein
MPVEASRLVRINRRFNISSAIISAIAGLSAWPVIQAGTIFVAQAIVAVFSFTAALLVSLPAALGLRERADEAIYLSAEYGSVYGDLLDAREQYLSGAKATLADVNSLIKRFESVKRRKDKLGFKPRRSTN